MKEKTDRYQFDSTLQIFYHHIYEYKKGIRNLILLTTFSKYRDLIEKQLKRHETDYLIYPLGRDRINVFFGNGSCIKVIRTMNKPDLTELSNEEDFMLGIMLGYDRLKQCERYVERKLKPRPEIQVAI